MSVLPAGMVGGLVEVVLRVKDLGHMQAFHEKTLGLPLWRRFGDDMAFFKLPETIGGRSQAVALFVDRWPSNVAGHAWAGLDPTRTTIHHLALAVDLASLVTAASLLRAVGLAVTERTFPRVGWRSLMLQDPERNVVELVADDPSICVPAAN